MSGGSTGPTHGSSLKSGRTSPRRSRGRGEHFRFGGMNVLYDLEGYEYPINDYGQIYVLLEPEPANAMTIDEEKEKKHKKLKSSYASVAVAGDTIC